MGRWVVVLLVSLVLLVATEASAARVESVEATGIGSTKRAALLELLPREPPNEYTDAELAEFERRVRNLGLFDSVSVSLSAGVMRIDVSRKNNVEPEIAFSTGATPRDLELGMGALHHDIDGRATTLGIGAGYAERFAQFQVGVGQHTYRARKWAWEAFGYYTGSEVRFDQEPNNWVRGRLGGEFEVKPPYWYATPMHIHISINAYGEKSVFAESGAAPRGGIAVAPWFEVYWDRWTFHDLVPHGLVCGLRLAPGIFLGPNQARHLARFDCVAGVALGEHTVFAARGVVEGVNAGNANHSMLLGSLEGVRGLPDNLFRNRTHAYANVELRHAFDLGRRIYVQPVAFLDAARFQPMDARGAPQTWSSALSAGAGLRLLPTALIDTALRVDLARRILPSPTWFLQVGLEQYF